jgi:hypothetical protein
MIKIILQGFLGPRILKNISTSSPYIQLYISHLTETKWKSICGTKAVAILAETNPKKNESKVEGCKKV